MTDQTPTPIPPELVSAILRDPDSPLYPSEISVYCDDCGTTLTHDYMVDGRQSRPERLEVARTYLRDHEGWHCDELADLCPTCARKAN